jgi:isopentenyl diphosphate isomerase/L-lactate dehydrogenase-like FMN-dependent dehydrogenase
MTPLHVGDLPPRLRFDSYDDAASVARRRLPRAIFERLTAGAERGLTTRNNVAAFETVAFRPRGAAAAPVRDLSTTVLGCEVSLPVLLGPVGALRLFNADGVLAASRAAAAAGTICAISPGAGHSLAEVAAAGPGPKWWQVSTSAGRQAAEETLDAALEHGYGAIVVTIDSVVKAKVPPIRISARSAWEFGPDLLRRPRWTASFVRDGMRLNVVNAALGASGSAAPPISWQDFDWIRRRWAGRLVVKGVVIGDDAVRARDAGASAVIVSNHGGVVLDGTRPTLTALPEVVEAVGDELEVLFDGGIRWGSDAVKAIALGARAVLLGRAYVMGLAAGGDAGVSRMLELFRLDIDRTLALIGCPAVRALDRSYVEPAGRGPFAEGR